MSFILGFSMCTSFLSKTPAVATAPDLAQGDPGATGEALGPRARAPWHFPWQPGPWLVGSFRRSPGSGALGGVNQLKEF